MKSGKKKGTGSGKSTLALCLFRLLGKAAAGKIEIDGEDIAALGLDQLRSKLSIIPQDPVLFLGNIRSNLDPFGEHADAAVWRALDMDNSGFISAGEFGKFMRKGKPKEPSQWRERVAIKSASPRALPGSAMWW